MSFSSARSIPGKPHYSNIAEIYLLSGVRVAAMHLTGMPICDKFRCHFTTQRFGDSAHQFAHGTEIMACKTAKLTPGGHVVASSCTLAAQCTGMNLMRQAQALFLRFRRDV